MDETVTIDLKYLKELKAKAKAWDNFLKDEESQAEKETQIQLSACFQRFVDEKVEKVKNKYMEED